MPQFHALGGLAITVDGAEVALGGPRQRRLLAMFLIHRNTVVSVDRLADAVFAGEPTPGAATTLRSYVARIRRVVADDQVVTQAPGYLLAVGDKDVDVACFERGVAQADAEAERGDRSAAAATLRRALGLWQGDAYAEFADEDWARPEAQRLAELRLVATERLVAVELELGRADALIPELEVLVREHPTREQLRAQLMLALYRSGRHADALDAYQDHRRELRDELGLDPTPALVELERRILAHDPTLSAAPPAGRRIRGYVLGERLGRGRDGTVYAARVPGVARDLAIRIVDEALADDPAFVRTFESTARRVAALDHAAVVPVHDFWREPGAAYLVMRRLHGGSLADRLARGPLPPAEVARLVDRIGGALLAAAEVGLAHGRVGADNVLFDDAGEACLTDFALTAVDDGTAGRDVDDLVGLVGACLGDPAAVSLNGHATMATLVPHLVETLTHGAAPAPVPSNPYKGLRAFDEVDAEDLFGREAVVAHILERLGSGRLVLVVGGSGTGKSSVVRAGLLPAVRRGALPGSASWFVTTMVPGALPFAALAEGLRQVAVVDAGDLAGELARDREAIDRVVRRVVPEGGQMLLLVDQLEELFTTATDRDQRAFLDGILHAVTVEDSRLRVVATLRADFYDRPLAVSGFGAVVNEATVTIPALTASELEAAVVGPAARVGMEVESSLVAELVGAVFEEAGALPALQFTLYELAQRGRLTLAAYRDLGELDGAIAARAEGLYRSLDEDERESVRRLFEQLVVVTTGEEPTRRRAPRPELPGTSSGTVIDRWTSARLLSVDRHPQTRVPTVELAHEALLREWPRLHGWIDQEFEALAALSHLRDAATSWRQVDRDPGALYRGARLQLAEDVVRRRGAALAPAEQEFLDASGQARDAEDERAATQAARQVRANRRLRIQLVVIAAALVVALAGGLVAIDQRGEARQERRVATARELAAASEASVDEDAERAVLLALEAVAATRDHGEPALPEAVEALHRAVTASRVVLTVPGTGGALDWSPDGRLFVTEGPEETGLVELRDARTGDVVRSFPGHEVDVNDVAFSPDGSLLATTGDDGSLRLWATATGRAAGRFESGADEETWGPSFSADGRRVAVAWPASSTVGVFEVASGRQVAELDLPGAEVTSLSGDGRRVAVGSYLPGTTVFDVDGGRPLYTVNADLPADDVALSPDDRWLATTSGIGRVRLWHADTGAAAISLTGHSGFVAGVDWSPDGSRLATVSDDGTARVTEVADGQDGVTVSLSADDTGNGLYDVAFSPDGQRIMTADIGGRAVKVWDVSPRGGAEVGNLPGAQPHAGAAFTPDGDAVVVAEPGGLVVHPLDGGDVRRVGRPPAGAHQATDFSVADDGTLAAIVWDRSRVEIWDLASGVRRVALPADVTGGFVADVAWTHRGHRLAIGATGVDGAWISVVDDRGRELVRLPEAEVVYDIGQLTFSADDRLLANTRVVRRNVTGDMGARVWDWEAEEPVRLIATPSVVTAFAPDGERLVTVRQLEGAAEVWDAGTGELLVTLPTQTAFNDIAFSADGARLATAGSDGVVRLWDAETGDEELVLRGHPSTVRAVAFDDAGASLVSVGDDGVARVWALDLDRLVDLASGRLTRSLTDAECREHLHLPSCPAR